jgi:magnesium and cobalt transporter
VSDERSESGDKTWLEKIAQAFNHEPRSREELLEVLQIAADNEVIDGDTHEIIQGAIEVTGMQVRDVMIPRPQMVVIKIDEDPQAILERIVDAGHSRYPVVAETSDDVKGILLAKDLLWHALRPDPEDLELQALLRPATFIPESKRLTVLLREFRENRNHMAIVIDEYGGVAGLVTIEDVLEEIVGDIADEYDKRKDSFIRRISSNDYLIRALTPIEEFNEYFDAELNEDEFDTIGGLVMQRFGYLPRRNEVATVEGFRFKVLNADSRQIHLLRLSLREDE